MTPLVTSRISSRRSMACGFSSLAMMGTDFPNSRIRLLAVRMSSAERTNDKATTSTPCFRPNSRSTLSLPVRESIVIAAPGRLMPCCSPSTPPFRTSHSTSWPRTERTLSSMRPSDKSTRAPGTTSRARPGKSVEISSAVPATLRGVIVSNAPDFSSTCFPSFRRPVRIFGPCKSWRIQIVRPRSSAARRSLRIRAACSAWVPWEKFRRATSMPRRIRSRIISSESLAGPIVQTIFARRARWQTPAAPQLESAALPEPVSFCVLCKQRILSVRNSHTVSDLRGLPWEAGFS